MFLNNHLDLTIQIHWMYVVILLTHQSWGGNKTKDTFSLSIYMSIFGLK
jgi:hypothetical protein